MSHEFSTDILEIIFESFSLDEYNAFRIVCKTWHILLLDPKWYCIVRRNTPASYHPEKAITRDAQERIWW